MTDWTEELHIKPIMAQLEAVIWHFDDKQTPDNAAASVARRAFFEIKQLKDACKEWAEVSQQNYQRAKAAQAALEEHKQGALEAIKLVGQSARNAGLWQGKAEGLAIILTDCVNDLEQAINGNVHKESMEELIDRARQAVDNLSK